MGFYFFARKKEYVKPAKVEKRKKKHTKLEESESESDKEETKEEKKIKTEEVVDSREKISADGNMIVLESDDSMWKSTGVSEKHNEDKAREEEFEEYLEDLFF